MAMDAWDEDGGRVGGRDGVRVGGRDGDGTSTISNISPVDLSLYLLDAATQLKVIIKNN